ncbi:hypothetical protein KSF_089320 [Reticulibacter mediterranei]|uniref:TIR domain-containing protein n=1 Tax=Reticulibacter mediterranei TaxID=2778369 RepID=A0A8J3IW11_9CHLR|nr:TIR domain-containing protein [Reticulibacter mediterranei]GHO98884.1 hypothetical protein KSF_089320 [Reticulibacter mediterranei]
METTEYWIRPGQKKAIALLHGIGAKDPQDYWHAFLDIVVNDEQLQEFGVFVWKYPTHVGSGWWNNMISTATQFTLRETAPQIKQLGAVWDTTYHTQFRDYQDVFLICHSMGGLVVKSWVIDVLESGHSDRLEQLRHIAFYATPHNGAPVTTLANWNRQLKDMQLKSPLIEDIGNRWHNHVVAWKERNPGPKEHLYNRYIAHLVVAGLVDRVVPSNFATIRGINVTQVQGDHSEVIQPRNADDTRYKVWRHALDENMVRMLPRSQTIPETLPAFPSSLPQQITPPSPASSVVPQHPSSNYHSCVLSYATEDQAFAEKLYTDLHKQGVSCWFAEQDLKQGDKLRPEIYRAINKQDKLLLILSEHAIESHWVEEEFDVARDRELRQTDTFLLFPLRLDETVFTTEKYWAITVRQRYIGDFCQWQDETAYQQALQRLLRDLHL